MRKTIMLALLFLLVGSYVIYAQTPVSESSTSGTDEEWSVDSQVFSYLNPGKNLPRTNSTNSRVFLEHPYWESFNPDTSDWFETTVWPLYPDLSEAEKAIFQTVGFMRTSPDREIIIYASANNKLTIANRTTQQIFETDIDYEPETREPIWWSEDSQGVAVEGSGNSPYVAQPIVYYIRLSDRMDLAQTDIYLVRWAELMIVGERLFTPVETERILDVHEHQVLTTMSDVTGWGNSEQNVYRAQSYLVIWNPEKPEASIIIDAFNGSNVRAAAFVPNDPQRLMVILGNVQIDLRFTVQLGLYVYDIQTHDLQFVAGFDGYYIESPFFSLDGNWLAVQSSEANKYGFFQTSDLLGLPPLAAPTLFPTFTPFPTYTPTPVTTSTPSP